MNSINTGRGAEPNRLEEGLTHGWERFIHRFGLSANPRLLIVGLERTGLALCRFFQQFHVTLLVTDKKDSPALRESLNRLSRPPAVVELGGHSANTFDTADCIFVSPGVPLSLAELQEPIRRGIPVTNDIELCHHFHRGPIVGITGSNGKTTVTTLIGRLLSDRPNGCTVAGNIGLPVADFLMDEMIEEHTLVLEISNFQLEAIRDFRPAVGVLLNLAPDHLDRYAGVADYYRAKWRLFENQVETDWAVLNYDDREIRAAAGSIRARKFWFSRQHEVPCGIWLEGDIVRSNSREVPDRIISLAGFSLGGIHNRDNALAAAAAALLLGAVPAKVQEKLTTFAGIAHRFEKIADFNGREFINDSKATNVDSVRAGLTDYPRPIRLILGGRNKGGDFRILSQLIRSRVAAVYVIGEAAQEIANALAGTVAMIHCESLAESVRTAWLQSRPGETILLAPGCASFDMFKNYEDRGNQFREIVAHLIREQEEESSEPTSSL